MNREGWQGAHVAIGGLLKAARENMKRPRKEIVTHLELVGYHHYKERSRVGWSREEMIDLMSILASRDVIPKAISYSTLWRLEELGQFKYGVVDMYAWVLGMEIRVVPIDDSDNEDG